MLHHEGFEVVRSPLSAHELPISQKAINESAREARLAIEGNSNFQTAARVAGVDLSSMLYDNTPGEVNMYQTSKGGQDQQWRYWVEVEEGATREYLAVGDRIDAPNGRETVWAGLVSLHTVETPKGLMTYMYYTGKTQKAEGILAVTFVKDMLEDLSL